MQNLKDDILTEYLAECSEMLEKLTANLSVLEKEHFDKSILRGFARDVHTVKGSSQLFGFRNIGRLSHAVEECLERAQHLPREDLLGLTDVLFESLDQITKLFAVIKSDKKEPEVCDGLEPTLAKLARFGQFPEVKPATSSPVESLVSGEDSVSPSSDTDQVAEILADTLKSENRQPSIIAGARQAREDLHGDSVRVNVDLLDSLMSLVGELVLIRNEVGKISKEHGGDSLLGIHQRLNAITSELQNNVMKTRMQPIGNLLGKFQRTVRDLSKELGKFAELELEGGETELDKALLETVRDPLIHIIRNSIDHGIERPEERAKLGKPSSGMIRVRAIHENGFVTIEVQDDGRGIHHDKVRTKAFEKGLLTPDLLGKLSDQETLQLVFLPGFSTADHVSDVSGRGIGMDVVKTNIERIGGAVHLRSRTGEGTQVILKIPLTLAIISALLVRSNHKLYAIPQVKLLELLNVDRATFGGMSGLGGESTVIRLRGRLLALIDLREVLREPKDAARDILNVVVVHAEHKFYGLIVDEIVDSLDIVVKPLSSIVKSLGVYTGASILADGSTALILDVNGIAEKHSFLDVAEPRSLGINSEILSVNQKNRAKYEEDVEYILFDIGIKSACAVPLCLVYRLEEFSSDKIQTTGSRRAVKYGDVVLTIINLKDSLGLSSQEESQFDKSETVVIVIKRGSHYVGFEVDKISDILLSSAEAEPDVKARFGIVGSIIHNGQVILLLDLLALASRVLPLPVISSSILPEPPKQFAPREQFHLLLVEDGNFIRKQVATMLRDAGYRVTTEVNGLRALEKIESSRTAPFSLIVSDIEMPIMDGFEFIQKLRSDPQWHKLPAIALTSRYSALDVDRGLNLGFNKYLEKIDANQLIYEIDRMLGLAERY